jgi:2-amino-4-hydroxy-6-hydroxymethyldihydropteridine diphosphokinase
MKTVYLSLGSNMGNRAQNIARAIKALDAHGIRVVRESSLYETAPIEVRGHGWFLNCAIEVETQMMPLQLMRALLQIEHDLGRKRRPASSHSDGLKDPRIIDIDILLFGESIVNAPELEIPHPRMAERRFVLVPLNEIAPGLRHPTLNATVAELLASTADRSQVRLYHSAEEA